ncbi:hypothetical protein FHS10_003398 [Mucilaginibacter dorajii]|nr:hypothetical protein [Mucilaginibacter dorajii]
MVPASKKLFKNGSGKILQSEKSHCFVVYVHDDVFRFLGIGRTLETTHPGSASLADPLSG